MKKLIKFSSFLFLGIIAAVAFTQPLEARSRSWFSFGIGFGGFAPAPAPVVVERYYAPVTPVYHVVEVPSCAPTYISPPTHMAPVYASPAVVDNNVPLYCQNRYVAAPRTYVYRERIAPVAPVNYSSFSFGFSTRR